MRVLVALANHGTKNDGFARQLIDEYRSMRFEVQIVVLTNIEKDWGEDVEIRVGAPTPDPWSLPFGHKQLFADRIEDYDLFIYSEDDTLIREAHLDAFLEASASLPDHLLPGFLRKEHDGEGNDFVSTIHSFCHWEPGSVEKHGAYTTAFFTNEHSACFVVTREQLRRAIDSGGFLVAPHQEKYDLLCSAATDPYTQCGFRKVICVSHLDDFILEHLPNVYLGKMGLAREAVGRQVEAMERILAGELPSDALVPTITRLWRGIGSRDYYEEAREDLVELVPRSASRVLSVGCGWGATEAALIERGHEVTGVPLDAIIGILAGDRGLEIVNGDMATARATLEGRSFDAILFPHVLHHAPDPAAFLNSFGELLAQGGVVLASLPNPDYLPILWRRFKGRPGFEAVHDHEESGVQPTDRSTLREWFRSGGLRIQRMVAPVEERFEKAHRMTLGLRARTWATDLYVLAARA